MTKVSKPQKAKKSLFSRALSYVKSFFHIPSTTECSCEDGDRYRICIKKNKKIKAKRVRADNNAMLEARKAHAKADKERLEAEAKAEEERLLEERKDYSTLFRLSSMKLTIEKRDIGYESDDGSNNCFAIILDDKLIFFILDGKTSTIKVLNYGTDIIIHPFQLNPDRLFKISNELEQEYYFESVDVGYIKIDDDTLVYQIVQPKSFFDANHAIARLKETNTVSNHTGASFTYSDHNCKCTMCNVFNSCTCNDSDDDSDDGSGDDIY